MTNRDRIAKIIRNARMNANPLSQVGYAEADALLANGVIVPPCKVGTPLFFLNDEDMHGGSVIESTEWIFVYDTDGLIFNTEVACFEYSYDYTFGKTVFLTKEEAEAKLKELNNNAT